VTAQEIFSFFHLRSKNGGNRVTERLTTSITLYGEFDTRDSKMWLDYYFYCKDLIQSINFKPTHLGITGQSFKSGKIMNLDSSEKKLFKSLEKGEELVSLAVYSLPEDYSIAAFDYDIYMCRTKQLGDPYIIMTFRNDIFDEINVEDVIKELKKYINFNSGQIFQMSNLESPQIYASKANSPSTFKSLKIIREL
jgi:hypothetical protein